MRYLIDTDTASYFLRGGYPDLDRRLRAAIRAGEAAISAMTRAEMRYGQYSTTMGLPRIRLQDSFLQEIPNLDWTPQAADEYGHLRAELEKAGTPIGILDTQIAAHALALDLILVTNNQKHFKRVEGLRTENWTR